MKEKWDLKHTPTHPHFHLNSEIVHTVPSSLNAILETRAWSSISFPGYFARAYLWTLVLWERLSRKPGPGGSSPNVLCHPNSGRTGVWLGFCLQLIILLSRLIWIITWWLREIFHILWWDICKNDTIILFTGWILIDRPSNSSLILCKIHHSKDFHIQI